MRISLRSCVCRNGLKLSRTPKQNKIGPFQIPTSILKLKFQTAFWNLNFRQRHTRGGGEGLAPLRESPPAHRLRGLGIGVEGLGSQFWVLGFGAWGPHIGTPTLGVGTPSLVEVSCLGFRTTTHHHTLSTLTAPPPERKSTNLPFLKKSLGPTLLPTLTIKPNRPISGLRFTLTACGTRNAVHPFD